MTLLLLDFGLDSADSVGKLGIEVEVATSQRLDEEASRRTLVEDGRGRVVASVRIATYDRVTMCAQV